VEGRCRRKKEWREDGGRQEVEAHIRRRREKEGGQTKVVVHSLLHNSVPPLPKKFRSPPKIVTTRQDVVAVSSSELSIDIGGHISDPSVPSSRCGYDLTLSVDPKFSSDQISFRLRLRNCMWEGEGGRERRIWEGGKAERREI
jgi:hypothetical protein